MVGDDRRRRHGRWQMADDDTPWVSQSSSLICNHGCCTLGGRRFMTRCDGARASKMAYILRPGLGGGGILAIPFMALIASSASLRMVG